MQRFPEGTAADIDDFRCSGWEKAIDPTTREGYSSIWHYFSDAARAALENGDVARGKVLWLLADASSMMLRPQRANEPFQPVMVVDGKRSSLPEDFQDSDIGLLAQISEEINHPWLQARLADLVWLLRHPRSPKHALIAIDAYRALPLDVNTWISGGKECWERAISLARMLGAGAGERLQEIEASISDAFHATQEGDGFLAVWLSDLLFDYRLGQDQMIAISDKLQALARILDDRGDLHRSREHFAAAARWFKRGGDGTKAAEMAVCVAEAWVKEAVAQMSSERPSNLVAASFYESAIQAYRTVPRAERGRFKVEERLAELHREMSEAGARARGEMGVITSPPIDLTEMVKNARRSVSGKDATKALLALANIYPGFQVERLRTQAEEMLKEFPIQAIFPATHVSRDGRVIAKRPGMESGGEGYEATVWAEMIKNYGIELCVAVQGGIWPALDVVVLEHRLREGDFISLARRSPIVPAGRERLFGKALFAGYERDLAGALHVLVPQIEHMIRTHLKAAGVKTTTLDKAGIENESGLSTLMDLPEVAKIFGGDIAFEIRALFCDPLGQNLRNELAHGLLDDDDCQSPYVVYAWWLGLRLVFITFWNALRRAPAPRNEGDLTETDETE